MAWGSGERLALCGVVATLAVGLVSHHDATGAWLVPRDVAGPATGSAAPTGGTTGPSGAAPVDEGDRASQDARVVSLAAGSALRRAVGPNVDQVCGGLGMEPDAWLPGQTRSYDLTGRVLTGPRQAYSWTCGQAGPRVRLAQMDEWCQSWHVGTTARTWDLDYAYSWVCI